MTGSPSRVLFVSTILLGSFLLFLVQPMVARMALPLLGGAPNVWNSAMLVYQALLLGGYAYAHLISRLAVRHQALVHLSLLALGALTLPFALPEGVATSRGSEFFLVPLLFLATVGPVFFAVSAQAPMMQSWYASHPRARDPYPLYAASNLGSLAGLLAYPLLVEPMLPLSSQAEVWRLGYLLLFAFVCAAAISRRNAGPSPTAQAARTTAEGEPDRVLLWIILAAVPSGLMLSTTTFLTTDIMAMPMLWVIPLALYLLSFSVAFAEDRRLAKWTSLSAPLVLLVGARFSIGEHTHLGVVAGISALALLFWGSVSLHSRLYDARPPVSGLTRFYLYISLGGVIGGAFAALVAPLVFSWTWEHPILILSIAALVSIGPLLPLLGRLSVRPALFRTALVLCVGLAMLVPGLAKEFSRGWGGERVRSYFGVYTLVEGDNGWRSLIHGTTTHGAQAGDSLLPTTYYGATSGAGQVLQDSEALFGERARVGVVGLGVGTLACYRKPDQKWTFFEIDPKVLSFSERGSFTFLSSCAPDAEIVIGDARLELARINAAAFDVLLVDAFSSDSIPLHLVTKEAVQVYRRAIRSDGVILVHITNRYIELEPVVGALAKEAGLSAAVLVDVSSGVGRRAVRSVWVAMSADETKIERIRRQSQWRDLDVADSDAWSDDHASLLPFIRWDNVW